MSASIHSPSSRLPLTLEALVSDLSCPYCGGGLSIEPGALLSDAFGVLRCGCYRYPILDGIIVLRQQSSLADGVDPCVVRLDEGDPTGAIATALTLSPSLPGGHGRIRRAIEHLRRHPIDLRHARAMVQRGYAIARLMEGAEDFRRALQLARPPLYAEYLYQRYANPSFLASVPLLLLIGNLTEPCGRVLEIGSGIGHSSFLLNSLFPTLSVTATDYDFTNAFIARRYVAPEVTFICLDAEAPLPFARGAFDGVFCLDAFHYIRSKRSLLLELKRVARSHAIWAFAHVHNAAARNYSRGLPLELNEYRRLFQGIDVRVLSELEVLSAMCSSWTLDLSKQADDGELAHANAFTIVGGPPRLWRRHEELWFRLARQTHALGINPLYRASRTGTNVRLRMEWPSRRLESECTDALRVLPRECLIDSALFAGSANRLSHPEHRSLFEELVRSCVLVQLPAAYHVSTT